MLRFPVCAALAVAGFSLQPISAVQGASFDCTKAAKPFEKAICGDEELSKADERLAKTYATAIGGLSEFALGQMRTSQREWLDYARRACTRDAVVLTEGTYDEWGLRCLRDIFNSRSRMLETSRMIEGDRYYPVARFAAHCCDRNLRLPRRHGEQRRKQRHRGLPDIPGIALRGSIMG